MGQPITRKKRDTSKKKEEILDGAIEAFREFGYDAVNMDQIAEKAGASKRTLYNHFCSKEDLLQAVISRYLNSYQKRKEGIYFQKEENLQVQLSRFIDAEVYLVNSPQRMTLAKVLTSIFLWNSELAVKTQKRFNQKEDPLRVWLQEASRSKKLSVKDPAKTAELFHSLVQGAITWPALFQTELTENFIEDRKKMIIEMLLRNM